MATLRVGRGSNFLDPPPPPTRLTHTLTRPDPPKASMAVSNHRISLAKMTYCNLCNVLMWHFFITISIRNSKIYMMHFGYFDPTRPDPRVDPTRVHPCVNVYSRSNRELIYDISKTTNTYTLSNTGRQPERIKHCSWPPLIIIQNTPIES